MSGAPKITRGRRFILRAADEGRLYWVRGPWSFVGAALRPCGVREIAPTAPEMKVVSDAGWISAPPPAPDKSVGNIEAPVSVTAAGRVILLGGVSGAAVEAEPIATGRDAECREKLTWAECRAVRLLAESNNEGRIVTGGRIFAGGMLTSVRPVTWSRLMAFGIVEKVERKRIRLTDLGREEASRRVGVRP